MKLSKEYMTFLEGHRQFMEFKDKLLSAAEISTEKLIEKTINKNTLNKYKEDSQ